MTCPHLLPLIVLDGRILPQTGNVDAESHAPNHANDNLAAGQRACARMLAALEIRTRRRALASSAGAHGEKTDPIKRNQGHGYRNKGAIDLTIANCIEAIRLKPDCHPPYDDHEWPGNRLNVRKPV